MIDSAKAALDDKVTFTVEHTHCSVMSQFCLSHYLSLDQGNINLEYKRGILLSIIRVGRRACALSLSN